MLGPTLAELDNARDQLDQAQEELVGLMERCDRLERELGVARRKNRVYQVRYRSCLTTCLFPRCTRSNFCVRFGSAPSHVYIYCRSSRR